MAKVKKLTGTRNRLKEKKQKRQQEIAQRQHQSAVSAHQIKMREQHEKPFRVKWAMQLLSQKVVEEEVDFAGINLYDVLVNALALYYNRIKTDDTLVTYMEIVKISVIDPDSPKTDRQVLRVIERKELHSKAFNEEVKLQAQEFAKLMLPS